MEFEEPLKNRSTKQRDTTWKELDRLSRKLTGKPRDRFIRDLLEETVKKMQREEKRRENAS